MIGRRGAISSFLAKPPSTADVDQLLKSFK
jgi:hypothetical protein